MVEPGREQRPTPEALLAVCNQERCGKLKVFLGAAPGVGKTYEMLLSGHEKMRLREDAVVGILETHGRPETEVLLIGMEVIPRKRVEYKGHALDELDLDALLARHPKIALVDELAHTNAPGSRHAKRYQDVEELLAAGIDVYTTVNVQHLESLNDVVAKITGVRVRETVPDHVIEQADEIELIDITPGELIQRLQDGKVYVPHLVRQALEHYFSPGNLTALRELALRVTAQRVDAQMLAYMQAHAIRGPWAAGERILVAINESPTGRQLVRSAKRRADQLRCKWTALYVQTPRHHRLSDEERDRIAYSLRLAEKLGGEAVTLPGWDIVQTLLDYARQHNATQIILGKSRRSRWFEWVHGSVVQEIVRGAGDITVSVFAGEEKGAIERVQARRPPSTGVRMWPYLVTVFSVAAALAIALVIDLKVVHLSNESMFFLVPVLFVAVKYGLGPSLFASVLSFLAYNFFFLPPVHTFTIAEPANVVAAVVLFLVAVITSNLAARTRIHAELASAQARTTAELYAFSKKLAAVGNLDDLLAASAVQISGMLKAQVVLLLPQGERLVAAAGYPHAYQLEEQDLAAARWVWDNNRPAGRGSDTLPGVKWLFLPLRTERRAVSVLGITRQGDGPMFTPEESHLLDALADLAAIAIERVRLVDEVEEGKLQSEAERLHAALLTSISHDLGTPLASILGAITSLRAYGDQYDASARAELMTTIQEEAERLNRFVGNLLDMTRLESGALQPKLETVDLAEVAGTALARTARTLAQHRVEVDVPADLPGLDIDYVLFEQVLVNLLDNAAKYTPPNSRVRLTARQQGQSIVIQVADEGEGIPPQALEQIFEKFRRIDAGDRQRAGTGLGLAICRGFVQAMGGAIEAYNRTDRSGAVFRIVLPLAPTRVAAVGGA
jgi:two-component system, OmpR family, sensor histidine kinase KdpD